MYFSVTDDLDLLPVAQREHAELERVAAEAEYDVLAWLAGHDAAELTSLITLGATPEAHAALDPGFLVALKLAVARVSAHRLQTLGRTPGVSSETRGERSVSYDTRADALWPVGWASGLAGFRVRPTPYRI